MEDRWREEKEAAETQAERWRAQAMEAEARANGLEEELCGTREAARELGERHAILQKRKAELARRTLQVLLGRREALVKEASHSDIRRMTPSSCPAKCSARDSEHFEG